MPDTYTTATTYTTQTYTTQTYTTTPEIGSDTDTTNEPTIIIVNSKKLVTKEIQEYNTRRTIEFVKKHFLSIDNADFVTKEDIDDFFDKLEEEEAAAENSDEDTPEGESDNP